MRLLLLLLLCTPACAKPKTLPVVTAGHEPKSAGAAGASTGECTLAGLDGLPIDQRLEQARTRCGPLLLFAGEQGIEARTVDLLPVATLTTIDASGLKVVRTGTQRAIYYLAPALRQVRRINLNPAGPEEVLATVPVLRNRCFQDSHGSPLQYIQSDSDMNLDPEKGVLCFIARDRNENMMSVAVNYRVDLRTGKTRFHIIDAEDNCLGKKERVSSAVCDTEDAAGHLKVSGHGKADDDLGDVSPSKRWTFIRSEKFGAEGDYIYQGAFLRDNQKHQDFAVLEDRLLPFPLKSPEDDEAEEKGTKPREAPKDLVLLASEQKTQWHSRSDVLWMGGRVVRPGAEKAVVSIPAYHYSEY